MFLYYTIKYRYFSKEFGEGIDYSRLLLYIMYTILLSEARTYKFCALDTHEEST